MNLVKLLDQTAVSIDKIEGYSAKLVAGILTRLAS